jgi:hypothetical protein
MAWASEKEPDFLCPSPGACFAVLLGPCHVLKDDCRMESKETRNPWSSRELRVDLPETKVLHGH